MTDTNAWNNIPLDDYESHMKQPNVGQAQLLNVLTKKYLQKHSPEHILFLGISGGNGLEHISQKDVKRIFAIDVNQSYLEETHRRYGNKLKQLQLVNADINTTEDYFIKANLIWGALILEYVDVDQCFRFLNKNTAPNAVAIFTIQSNNGVQSISQTRIESLNAIEHLFQIVNADELQHKALSYGFELQSREENMLPNGKSFITFEFVKHDTIA